MNGLLSGNPARSAIRLAVGGFLLLLVQSLLLLLAPGLGHAIRVLLWIMTPIAILALIAALVGLPQPSDHHHWGRRRGR